MSKQHAVTTGVLAILAAGILACGSIGSVGAGGTAEPQGGGSYMTDLDR